MAKPTKIVSGVLTNNDKVLLSWRKNTQFFPDFWAFPVGHCEINENDIDTLRRELYEEIGIQVINAEYITTLFDCEKNIEHVVFRVLEWRGEVVNAEPELCHRVAWFELSRLPDPLTPATQRIIDNLFA